MTSIDDIPKSNMFRNEVFEFLNSGKSHVYINISFSKAQQADDW